MKMLTVKVAYLPLLLLLLLSFDSCESVQESIAGRSTGRSFQSFYPFGYDAQDSFIRTSGDRCAGFVNSPYRIFNYHDLYVSRQIDQLKVLLMMIVC